MFKAAVLQLIGPGKRAAFVSEQFAFEKLSGNSRRVDRHERGSATKAVLMQRTGNHFLAGTRFARQKHRDVTMRQTADRSKHFLHGTRLSDDFGSTLCSFVIQVACVRTFGHCTFLTRAAQQINGTVDIERFGQILVRAPLKSAHGTVEITKGRHDDDGQSGIFVFDKGKQIESAHIVHANVA